MNLDNHSTIAAKRLLVVDDEPTVCEALERVLRLEGYHVTALAGGDEVLARLHDGPVDLVLLDLNLAGESGLTVCQRIHEEKPQLSVIGMTARPDQATAAAAAGVSALLEKPLDLPVLLGVLRNLLHEEVRGALP